MDADSKYFHHGLLKGNLGRCRYRFPGQFHIHLLNHGNYWAIHRSPFDRTRPIPGNVKELLIVFTDIWSCSSRFFVHSLQSVCTPLFLTIILLPLAISPAVVLAGISPVAWWVFTHPFITLRLCSQFGRFGCDWALRSLCHQFSYYFFRISFY